MQKNGATVQTYTYGDSQWRDLLTKVGGTTISYDASGNPKNWYNGTTYTGLTWKNGRQLAQITTGGRTSAYRYDADGIRTYKKVGSVAHEYRTLNGKVVYEKIGSGSTAKIMIFSYDAQGRPFAVKYSTNNGGSYITYFYALNQQGDVVKIFRLPAVEGLQRESQWPDGSSLRYLYLRRMGQYSLAIRQHGQHQPSALSRLLLRFRNRLLLFAVPLLRPRNQTVYQCGCLQQYRFQRRCFLQYVRVLWE